MSSPVPSPSTPPACGTPLPRRTQEERRNQAEQALLHAATRLFARQGIDQTSLAEVGEEAGYSRGLVNHHFGSKAALVERLASRTQHDFVASLGKAGDREERGGRELEALVTIVDAYLVTASENVQQARAFFVMWGAALPAEASLRPILGAQDAGFRSEIEAIVRLGQEHGTVRPAIDPEGVAVAVVGMVRGVVAQFLVSAEGIALGAARGTCEQFIRRTLTPAPED